MVLMSTLTGESCHDKSQIIDTPVCRMRFVLCVFALVLYEN